MQNMNSFSYRNQKIVANVIFFQNYVKGHGEGIMFKIYGTIGKALSYGTPMPNMKALPLRTMSHGQC